MIDKFVHGPSSEHNFQYILQADQLLNSQLYGSDYQMNINCNSFQQQTIEVRKLRPKSQSQYNTFVPRNKKFDEPRVLKIDSLAHREERLQAEEVKSVKIETKSHKKRCNTRDFSS